MLRKNPRKKNNGYFDYIFVRSEMVPIKTFGKPQKWVDWQWKIERLRYVAELLIKRGDLDNFIEIRFDAEGNVSYYKDNTITDLIEGWNGY